MDQPELSIYNIAFWILLHTVLPDVKLVLL